MKKLQKTILGLLLAANIGTLAACGGGNNDGKTTITFLGWGSVSEIAIFQKLIDDFEEENPQYKVDYKQADAETYLMKLVNSGRRFPDVFYMPDVNFVQVINGLDIMLDITSYVEQSSVVNMDNVYEEGINAYRFDSATKTLGTGAIYALPKDLGPNVMCYNKTHVTNAGVKIASDKAGTTYQYGYGYYQENGEQVKVLNDQIPMTWAQMLQFCIDVTGALDQSKGITGLTHYPWEAVYISMGGRFLSDDYSKVTIDNDKFAEAVQIAGDFHSWGVMPSVEQQATQDGGQRYNSGLAVLSWMGAWESPKYWDATFDWDILPAPVPNVSGIDNFTGTKSVRTELMTEPAREGSKSTYKLGSVGLSVYKNSKNPEAAYKLVEYLTYNQASQRYMWKTGQAVPNLKDMAEGEFLTGQIDDPRGMNRPKNRQVYIDMLYSANRRPEAFTYDTEWYSEINGTAIDNLKLRRVWAGDVTLWDWSQKTVASPSGAQTYAENMLKNLQTQVQKIFDDGNLDKNNQLRFKWNSPAKV